MGAGLKGELRRDMKQLAGDPNPEKNQHFNRQGEKHMFNQLLSPVGGSLVLSVLVAALPIATVLVALGVLRRPAWQASLAGLVVGLAIAIAVWKFPVGTRARQRRGRGTCSRSGR